MCVESLEFTIYFGWIAGYTADVVDCSCLQGQLTIILIRLALSLSNWASLT